MKQEYDSNVNITSIMLYIVHFFVENFLTGHYMFPKQRGHMGAYA